MIPAPWQRSKGFRSRPADERRLQSPAAGKAAAGMGSATSITKGCLITLPEQWLAGGLGALLGAIFCRDFDPSLHLPSRGQNPEAAVVTARSDKPSAAWGEQPGHTDDGRLPGPGRPLTPSVIDQCRAISRQSVQSVNNARGMARRLSAGMAWRPGSGPRCSVAEPSPQQCDAGSTVHAHPAS